MDAKEIVSLKDRLATFLELRGSRDFSKLVSDAIDTACSQAGDPEKSANFYHREVGQNIIRWGEIKY